MSISISTDFASAVAEPQLTLAAFASVDAAKAAIAAHEASKIECARLWDVFGADRTDEKHDAAFEASKAAHGHHVAATVAELYLFLHGHDEYVGAGTAALYTRTGSARGDRELSEHLRQVRDLPAHVRQQLSL